VTLVLGTESSIEIRDFEARDQVSVRTLVEESMRERWPLFDRSANSDLWDIAKSFKNGIMYVAAAEAGVVGCGGLLPEGHEAGRIVRMSVAREHRGKGIGTALLRQLMAYARGRRYTTLVLETTNSWSDAIAFYERYGFVPTRDDGVDRHFELRLQC
jgi:GNAT superfamily N-acetyltransferase